ncbi:hypothetical protein BJX64DRAFT_258876 [Aspergillus heterothallicus]
MATSKPVHAFRSIRSTKRLPEFVGDIETAHAQSLPHTSANKPMMEHERTKTDQRILLAVHLREEKLDLAEWHTLIANKIPLNSLSVGIALESSFKTSDTAMIILVTLPLEIWTMLDTRDEAFSFVAHVQSNDILPTRS